MKYMPKDKMASFRKVFKFLSKNNSNLTRELQFKGTTYSCLRYFCKQTDDQNTVKIVKSEETGANDESELTRNRDLVIARNSHGKTIDVVVSSLRIDRVAATALGIGRKKLQYAMLGGKLFLNKERVDKGSVLVWENDKIDVMSDNQIGADSILFSRVEVDRVGELTSKGNTNLTITRYKNLVTTRSNFEEKYKTQL